MADSSGVDPLTSGIDSLHAAMTVTTGHAEGANGRITIACTADGRIADWHVDDALRAADVHAVVECLVGLQRAAVEQARQKLVEATDAVFDDPRFADLVDSVGDATNQPRATEEQATDCEVDHEPVRGIFESPVGRPHLRR